MTTKKSSTKTPKKVIPKLRTLYIAYVVDSYFGEVTPMTGSCAGNKKDAGLYFLDKCEGGGEIFGFLEFKLPVNPNEYIDFSTLPTTPVVTIARKS